MPAIRRPALFRAPLLTLVASGLVCATAGQAFAGNHDVQRVSLRCGVAKHDRAPGPLASLETPSRGFN